MAVEFLVPIGRLLFSAIFISSGLNHFSQRAAMVEYAKSNGVPAPGVLVPLTGAMIVLGGLSVLLGYYTAVGTWLLVVFLIPTAFFMHRFWGVDDPMVAATQMSQFMKNLALAGAALLIAYFGSGPYSLGG